MAMAKPHAAPTPLLLLAAAWLLPAPTCAAPPAPTLPSGSAFLPHPTGDDLVSNSSAGIWCIVQHAGEDGEPLQVSCNGTILASPEEEFLEPGSREWSKNIVGAFACTLAAALAAGLTLGLTSLDEFNLRVLCNRSVDDVEPHATEEEHTKAKDKLLTDQQYAKRILPLISGHIEVTSRSWMNPTSSHALLVTLLLANASANEALPLFLDELVPSWMAIFLSVSVVLIFGEVVPSAIFTGPSQLRLAALFSPVVWCIRSAFFPLVWPISLALDKCLSHTESEDRRGEMKATAKTLLSYGLVLDEVNMIHGVLDMYYKTAKDISKPINEAKMVAHDEVISPALIEDILSWGHSRLFVYRRDSADPWRCNDIVGVLLVKKLLAVRSDAGCRIEDVAQALKQPAVLDEDDNLLSVLNKFQDSMCHLAVVRKREAYPSHGQDVDMRRISEEDGEEEGDKEEAKKAPLVHYQSSDGASTATPADASYSERETIMFCSLEDVIETILKEEIYDEEDLEMGRVSYRPAMERADTTRSFFALGRALSSSRVSFRSRAPSLV